MRIIEITILLLLGVEISAQELPSEETLGEMVRDTSVEVMANNEAISYINAGNIDEAKRSLCLNLEANLLVLQWLAEYALNIEPDMLRKSTSHVARSSTGCKFSKETNIFLRKYK